MNIRKATALLLCFCLLASVLPMLASAYEPMTYSDGLVEFIKKNEGFTKYATWDYQQYSIGYGSGCNPGDYPDGITEEEADALLRAYLVRFVDVANDFCKKNGMQPNQGQFDCIVSLVYGLGSGWMTGNYDLPKLIIRGCTELELLNVLGDWVNANGSPLDGLIYRRMRENYMFFHGEYPMSGYIWEDVPYACLKFNGNGGKADYARIYTFRGERYGVEESLPGATRAGYRFVGWFDENGNRITNDTIAVYVMATAYAHWEANAQPETPKPDLFTDVYKTDWFFADVKAASERGFFTGYPDGSFKPNASMTRAMFAQVLYRIAGEPKLSASLPFTDVSSSDWYCDAVRWAYASGIVNGVSETRFAPDSSITREQMATMLFKYGAHMDSAEADDYGSLEGFVDAGSVSGYAVEPLQWAVGTGLINGVGENRLSPGTFATRAQASAILNRLTNVIKKGIA